MQLWNALQIDRVGEPGTQERSDAIERAIRVSTDICVMYTQMPVVDRDHDGGDLEAGERGIFDVVAK